MNKRTGERLQANLPGLKSMNPLLNHLKSK